MRLFSIAELDYVVSTLMPGGTIALLTHAPSDLSTMSKSLKLLPADFPCVTGFDLQKLQSEGTLPSLIADELSRANVILVRVLGQVSVITAFGDLIASARARNQNLLVVSGEGVPDAELTGFSNVSPVVLHQVQEYFNAGGVENIHQLLRYLCDHFLLTGYGYQPAAALPEHGIYHRDLDIFPSIDDWRKLRNPERPTVGITFYRAHWMSGNTEFIDVLADELAAQGLNALPVYTSSLKERVQDGAHSQSIPAAFNYFFEDSGKDVVRAGHPCKTYPNRDGANQEGKINGEHNVCFIDALINTTSFAAAHAEPVQDTLPNILSQLDVPVMQAICSSSTRDTWQQSSRGLNPMDTAMNVVMPEFDGRIITVPISFRATTENGRDGAEITSTYEPVVDRANRLAKIAAAMIRLRRLKNSDKRIAFILTNSSSKASQIGNAVGLDAPASLIAILTALERAGYMVDKRPENGDQLIHNLIDRLSYDQTYITDQQYRHALGTIPADVYNQWFDELPTMLKDKMLRQWGPPPGIAYTYRGELVIAGLEFGNSLVVLQPPRGYGMDPNAIYHTPDLPPTHHYYAFYRWLKDTWGTDALVHVGKHGTLEWLPGKGIGLSGECFPDALLADLPMIYPFIVNNPGEGAQAKRRAHAVIVDHLTPAMTSAETYGVLAELVHLVDEYYQMEVLDPSKLPLLQRQIWELIKKANLESDIGLILQHDHDGDEHGHDDHEHEWKESLTERGVPKSIAEMDGVAVSHLIQTIDGYLCELGMAEIRDGLHTFGRAPEGAGFVDMLCSLTRLPNLQVPSLPVELACVLGFSLSELQLNKGAKLNSVEPWLNKLAGRILYTNSDVLELIGQLSRKLYAHLQESEFDSAKIWPVVEQVLGFEGKAETNNLQATHTKICRIEAVLRFACDKLVPDLRKTSAEIDNLLRALDGRYIESGPSGAPTRGMANVLPTGRNFYSVDPRGLPSHSAWLVGEQLAHQVLSKYLKETGSYPKSVSLSVWGTSAMRTHGDDIAQILALMGVRPVWEEESHRVSGIEVIPWAQLKRPRIDVTVRISGFFRDAFPHVIELLSEAVDKVVLLDELPDKNFVREHYLKELAECTALGVGRKEAERRSRYRIFGSKPGSYGAGILHLINEKNWKSENDFAQAYINWGGYAYSGTEYGVDAREDFKRRLSGVEIALHNQDNREHDIFDSDDYMQFHGGMIATIASLTGKRPQHYFGDTSDPLNAQVRDLKEEVLRVFRSRVVNPKWLNAIQRHGYKGGLELVSTVDYLFGYDATSGIMEDWMYEQVAKIYALDAEIQRFLAEHNPWALNAISERLLEAAQRKMWTNPDAQILEVLQSLYLSSEAQLESREFIIAPSASDTAMVSIS